MRKEALLFLLESIFEEKIEQFRDEMTPVKGERGLRGKPGQPFDFESHKDDIFSIVKSYINDIKDSL